MDYGNYIYYKIKCWNVCNVSSSLFLFFLFLEIGCFLMRVCIVGVFCNKNCYFECGVRIRCNFLYIGTYFKDMF